MQGAIYAAAKSLAAIKASYALSDEEMKNLLSIMDAEFPFDPYDKNREARDFKKRMECPNGYFPSKSMCGDAHNCDPALCRRNRKRVALATKGDS